MDASAVGLADARTPLAGAWPRVLGGAGCDELNAFSGGGDSVAATGWVHTSIDLGGGEVAPTEEQAAFVSVYDSGGGYRWSRLLEATNGVGGAGVAVDIAGNVVAAGQFSGALDLTSQQLVGRYEFSSYLACFSEAGDVRWARSDGLDGGGTSPTGHAIDIDPSGNVYVVGAFSGRLHVEPEQLVSVEGSLDGFVAKYRAQDGGLLWVRQFGGTGDDAFTDVAVNEHGDIWVVGGFHETAIAGSETMVSAAGWDAVLIKYSSGGAVMRAVQFGGPGDDSAQAVGVVGTTDVVVAGVFEQRVSFGGAPLEDSGDRDVFVARYFDAPNRPVLDHVWSIGAGGAHLDVPEDLAVADDVVAVVGGFVDAIHCGDYTLESAGERDGFMFEFSWKDGAPVGAWRVGGQSPDALVGVVSLLGQPVVAGFFEDSIDLGGRTLQGIGCSDFLVTPLPVE